MAELDKQADIYERNKQADVMADFMQDFIKNPKQGGQTLTEMMNVMKMFGFKK